jgi:hypothetical protein
MTFTAEDTGDVLCIATLVAGTGSCDAVAGAVGTHAVFAAYSGDADHDAVSGSDRPELSVLVTKIGTAVGIEVSPATAAYGTAATLTANDLPADASGTITFTAGDTVLCSAVLPAMNCTTATSLGAGVYSVIATYSGDAAHTSALATTGTTIPPVVVALAAALLLLGCALVIVGRLRQARREN